MRVLLAAVLLAASAAPAIGADSDVQRQLRQREQSQTELRLKMQQQAERAVQSPRSPGAETDRRMLERDQQQRLQQLQEQQSRAEMSNAPGEAARIQSDIERQRAAQAAEEQLKRFELERRLETERTRP